MCALFLIHFQIENKTDLGKKLRHQSGMPNLRKYSYVRARVVHAYMH